MRGKWPRRSKVTIEIDSAAVPLLAGALELASQGLLTGGDKTQPRNTLATI